MQRLAVVEPVEALHKRQQLLMALAGQLLGSLLITQGEPRFAGLEPAALLAGAHRQTPLGGQGCLQRIPNLPAMQVVAPAEQLQLAAERLVERAVIGDESQSGTVGQVEPGQGMGQGVGGGVRANPSR